MLCEGCGYPRQGLDIAEACPECGLRWEQSDPSLRPPSAFASHPSLITMMRTAWEVLRRPRRFYRGLDLSGGNLLPRLYLLSFALLAGLMMGAGLAVLPGGREPVLVWAGGMLAAKSAIVLTYVEAGGVWFFSRQRGWRVPLAHAERVCCYAGPGWVVAAGVMLGVLYLLGDNGPFQSVLNGLHPMVPEVLMVVGLYAGLMVYEGLVYVGVRQVKFANRR